MGKMRIFLVGIGVLIFVIGLEAIYVFRNRPDLVLLGMEKVLKDGNKYSVNVSTTDIKLKSLINLAELRGELVVGEFKYIKSGPNVNISVVLENDEIKQAYIEILKKINYDKLFEPNSKELVKLFYLFGLEAYQLEEYQLVVSMWEIVLRLAPQWSYFHQELANYYLLQGQKEQSLKIIEQCLLYEFAKKSCLNYLDNNLLTNSPLEVGFWKQSVEQNYLTNE